MKEALRRRAQELGFDDVRGELGKLAHGEFDRIAEIHRTSDVVGRLHQADQPVDEVVHIAERPRLLASPIDRDRLVLQRLRKC